MGEREESPVAKSVEVKEVKAEVKKPKLISKKVFEAMQGVYRTVWVKE